MRAKVKKPFICKVSGSFNRSGIVIELTEERAEELKDGGYIEIIEKAEKPEEVKAVEKRRSSKSRKA